MYLHPSSTDVSETVIGGCLDFTGAFAVRISATQIRKHAQGRYKRGVGFLNQNRSSSEIKDR